jgi:hypothetical protein
MKTEIHIRPADQWPLPSDPALTDAVKALEGRYVSCSAQLAGDGFPVEGDVTIIDSPCAPDDPDPLMRDRSTYGVKWMQRGQQYGDFVEGWKSEDTRLAFEAMRNDH